MIAKPTDTRTPAAETFLLCSPHGLAALLAGLVVLLALIALSHEPFLQPDSRWSGRSFLTSLSNEAKRTPLEDPLVIPDAILVGDKRKAVGNASGEPAKSDGAEAEARWEEQTAGAERDGDDNRDPGRRREVARQELPARKETEEPAAPMAAPAPPESLVDRLDRHAVGQLESSGDGLTLPAESMEPDLADALPVADEAWREKTDAFEAPLAFQPAEGYWANTHVPGDPEIRLLHARLAQWDRSWLDGLAGLERDVQPVAQPFDAPRDNALALSLMTDVASVPAPVTAGTGTRMRLQVGIQGIEHRRGLRPAMNVGVVLDLPADSPDEVRIAARALLDALLQSKQAGDRFSLVLAGSGLAIGPDDFRFGPLQQFKEHILADNSTFDGRPVSPAEALELAGRQVAEGGDSDRPLGSRSVLLISAGALEDSERMAQWAHAQARDGTTLSVIPLGNRPENRRVEQLVLAGLGNRRILESPARARHLVEEELHAASRAVARAARLSIRLAAGVHLIDVIGSERLGAPQAQRVREIETSMDRRLSENLGIAADRGADEDGIQIVIPGIFSGDSVTVLLDVVVERPGAVADVSLRYKDLVFLRNGSLQAQLELPAGQPTAGPAQWAVMKNILSRQFSDAAGQAADALGRNDPAAALTALQTMQRRLERAQQEQAAWRDDPGLIRDRQVLDHYIRALALPLANEHQSGLADSLNFAAWAKNHRPLEEWNP